MSEQRPPEQLDAGFSPPSQQEPPDPASSMLTGISPGLLWTVAIALMLIHIYLVWFHIPGRQSDIAKKATAREDGQVRMKDSAPLGDGRVLLTVQVVYPDAQKKNHDVMNQLEDMGLWDSLKTNQYVKMRYVPDNPDMAYMEGASAIVIQQQGSMTQQIIRVTAPHAGALSLIGNTCLIASLPIGVLAYLNMRSPGPKVKKKKPQGPKVTLARR